MEFEVRMGKGYVPADMHEGLPDTIGLIFGNDFRYHLYIGNCFYRAFRFF